MRSAKTRTMSADIERPVFAVFPAINEIASVHIYNTFFANSITISNDALEAGIKMSICALISHPYTHVICYFSSNEMYTRAIENVKSILWKIQYKDIFAKSSRKINTTKEKYKNTLSISIITHDRYSNEITGETILKLIYEPDNLDNEKVTYILSQQSIILKRILIDLKTKRTNAFIKVHHKK